MGTLKRTYWLVSLFYFFICMGTSSSQFYIAYFVAGHHRIQWADWKSAQPSPRSVSVLAKEIDLCEQNTALDWWFFSIKHGDDEPERLIFALPQPPFLLIGSGHLRFPTLQNPPIGGTSAMSRGYKGCSRPSTLRRNVEEFGAATSDTVELHQWFLKIYCDNLGSSYIQLNQWTT